MLLPGPVADLFALLTVLGMVPSQSDQQFEGKKNLVSHGKKISESSIPFPIQTRTGFTTPLAKTVVKSRLLAEAQLLMTSWVFFWQLYKNSLLLLPVSGILFLILPCSLYSLLIFT